MPVVVVAAEIFIPTINQEDDENREKWRQRGGCSNPNFFSSIIFNQLVAL